MLEKERQTLLLTKFIPPCPHSSFIMRDHLMKQLEEGLLRKLILLSTSAGSGRTTLLSQWVQLSRSTLETSRYFCWISLSPVENTPEGFFSSLIAACRRHLPSLEDLSPGSVVHERALAHFCNDLIDLRETFVIILDDYHLITAPSVHQIVTFLLEHTPQNVHLIISTRTNPPLPLIRLRAKGHLYELCTASLRFSSEDLNTYVQDLAQEELISHKTVLALQTLTAGWITGIHLALMAIQGEPDISVALTSLTGAHPYFVEYIQQEVMAQQTEEIQEFLLKTVPLGHVTAALCDTLLGRDKSEAILSQLVAANFFLVTSDQRWYTYHPLFVQAIRSYAHGELGQDQLTFLCLEASRWYHRHGFMTEALDTALLAQQHQWALELIEHIVERIEDYTHLRHKYAILQHWLASFPSTLLDQSVILNLLHAYVLLFTARVADARSPLERAERLCNELGDSRWSGIIFTLWAILEYWWNDQSRTHLAYAHQALALLSERQMIWRSVSSHILTTEYKQNGAVAMHWKRLREVHALCQQVWGRQVFHDSSVNMADSLMLQGHLRQAALLYQEVLEMESEMSFTVVKACIGLGNIYFEWNILQQAEDTFSLLLTFDLQKEFNLAILYGFFPLIRIKSAQGHRSKARELLLRCIVVAQKQNHEPVLALAQAYEAWLTLQDGDLPDLHSWYTHFQPDLLAVFVKEKESLILARILLAHHQSAQALMILRNYLELAHTQGRRGSELEVLLLCALAYNDAREERQAFTFLLRALPLAHPEGYLRIFLEEGEPMAVLLRAFLNKHPSSPFVPYLQTILHAFPHAKQHYTLSTSAPSSLQNASQQAEPAVERLTQRERNILSLLADGLLYTEIARYETVSVNTVKTHLKNIYRKLQVNNRRDAIYLAQRLTLI